MAFPALSVIGLLVGLKNLVVQIAAFVIARWRVFLPLAMVALILLCIHTLREQRDEARQALAEYRAEVERSMQTFAQYNRERELAAARALDQVKVDHQVQFELLRRSTDAKVKDVQRDADDSDAAWRERLRLEISRNPLYGLSGVSGATGLLAEGRGERDATDPGQAVESYIDTLELGCAITTADYNACISGWAEACEMYGCR